MDKWDLSDSEGEIAVRPVVNHEMTDFDPEKALEDEDYATQAAAMQGLNYDKIPHMVPSKIGVIKERFNDSLFPPGNSDESFRVIRSKGPTYESVRVQANGVFSYENALVEGHRMRDGPYRVEGERIMGQWNSRLTADLWKDLRKLWSQGKGINQPAPLRDIPEDEFRPQENLERPIDYESWSVGDRVESEYKPLKNDEALVQRSPVPEDDPETTYIATFPQGRYNPHENVLPLQAVIGMGRASKATLEKEGVEPKEVSLDNSLKY